MTPLQTPKRCRSCETKVSLTSTARPPVGSLLCLVHDIEVHPDSKACSQHREITPSYLCNQVRMLQL